MLTLITIVATVVAYRGSLYVLNKSEHPVAKSAVHILGGGGPGNERTK